MTSDVGQLHSVCPVHAHGIGAVVKSAAPSGPGTGFPLVLLESVPERRTAPLVHLSSGQVCPGR